MNTQETPEFPPCEICGKPSVGWGRDLQETEPVEGKDGQMWATWKPLGEPHWHCQEHEYKPKSKFLDDTWWYGPEPIWVEYNGKKLPPLWTHERRVPESELGERG